MRLVVTGGGTGGHVFPALECAREAIGRGWEVAYLGSRRGQEGDACRRADVPFHAFASGPVYRPYTPKGLKSLYTLYRSSISARKRMQQSKPQAVLSMGGYASAPITLAAKRMGVPLVIHEQNSVPGRSNRLLSSYASRIGTVFHRAEQEFPADKVIRVGMPIRPELRQGAQGTLPLDGDVHRGAGKMILVMGGSQGSVAINDAALATSVRMVGHGIQWLHLTGKAHFERAHTTRQKMGIDGEYDIRAFADAEDMSRALFAATLAVSRSGAGSLAELAAFRIPAVLIPYPFAYAQHQRENAREFAELGAAGMLDQEELHPADLEGRLLSWLNDQDKYAAAQAALADWDIVDSVDRILKLVEEASA